MLREDGLTKKAFINDGLEKRQEDMKIIVIVLIKNFIVKFLIFTLNQLDTKNQ